MTTKVGFIGLGSQGGPMARRIVEEGYPLTIWARSPATLEPFRDTAATVASTPSQVGAASDVVAICVVADADVDEVLLGPNGVLAGMSTGGIVAIHSTIHPDTCQALADRAAERGIKVVDAPVSGGGSAAKERRLLVMAGGDEDSVARCRPIFETFADPVIHLGPLGSGQLAKVLNNFVFTAHIALALETYSFADRLGMDRATVACVLADGSGGSGAASVVAAAGFAAPGLRPAAALLRKDVGIMFDVARAKGAVEPVALTALARRTLELLGHTADA